MRTVALFLLLAGPALAGGPAYNPQVLAACLDRTAGDDGKASACIGKGAVACVAKSGGGTGGDRVSACLEAETQDWNAMLNRQYERALKAAKAGDAKLAKSGSTKPAVPVLKQAQRDWTTFRDSMCLYKMAQFRGGTNGTRAAKNCMLHVTAEQALRLRGPSEESQEAGESGAQ